MNAKTAAIVAVANVWVTDHIAALAEDSTEYAGAGCPTDDADRFFVKSARTSAALDTLFRAAALAARDHDPLRVHHVRSTSTEAVQVAASNGREDAYASIERAVSGIR